MKRIIISAFVFLLVSVAAVAQNGQGGRQRQRFNPAEMYEKMAERLAKQMKLSDDKADTFKVLYVDYQTARRNAVDPKGENKDEERVDLNKITDDEANALIQNSFEKQEAQLKVDKDYLPRFLEILTPAQAARIYVKAGMGRGMNQGGGQRPDGFPGGGFPGGGFPGGGPGGF